MPRTLYNWADLEELPRGTVFIDSKGDAFMVLHSEGWFWDESKARSISMLLLPERCELPVVVEVSP